MPLASEHEQKAGENENSAQALLDSGDITGTNDWVITMLFYSALHQVERKLAEENIHSGDHRERNGNIKYEISDRQVYTNYRELKDWSEQARYDCWEVEDEYITWSKDDLELIKSALDYS